MFQPGNKTLALCSMPVKHHRDVNITVLQYLLLLVVVIVIVIIVVVVTVVVVIIGYVYLYYLC